jgi:hypothetical protein
MLKTLGFVLALGLSGAAVAQQATADAKRQSPNAPEQSAAAGGTGERCDFMSREEMLVCQITKPGDATGVRSTLCDQVSANRIEACLRQQESVGSDPANEFRNRSDSRAASG